MTYTQLAEAMYRAEHYDSDAADRFWEQVRGYYEYRASLVLGHLRDMGVEGCYPPPADD